MKRVGAALIALPFVGAAALAILVAALAGPGSATDPQRTDAGPPGIGEIPAQMLVLYREAVRTCPGLPWAVVAAVGKIESDHGRNAGVSPAGARGPMQMLAPTFAAYAVDGDGDGRLDIESAADAVYSATRTLCANGAGHPGSLGAALYQYNHRLGYVEDVVAKAKAYQAAEVVAEVLTNSRIALAPQARADIERGLVSPRVLRALAFLAQRHDINVSVIRTGHSPFVRGTDRVSEHFSGRGVDIDAIDGAPATAANPGAYRAVLDLATSSGSLRPDEIGGPFPELARLPGVFHDADHLTHLHLGYRGDHR